jgi:hypothetical protein
MMTITTQGGEVTGLFTPKNCIAIASVSQMVKLQPLEG